MDNILTYVVGSINYMYSPAKKKEQNKTQRAIKHLVVLVTLPYRNCDWYQLTNNNV